MAGELAGKRIVRVRSRRQGSGKVRLQDVARRAGVSNITVSRVLREPEKVSEGLRREILGIIEEMGYVPDLAARALASGSSTLIGVLAPTLTHGVFRSFMRGIEERVRDTPYRIQYANSHYDAVQELEQLRLFSAQNPAGLIVVGIEERNTMAQLAQMVSCPVVQIVDIRFAGPYMSVGVDHHAATAEAVGHLLERNYRRIGLLGGTNDVRMRLKHDGYVETMTRHELFDEALIVLEDAPASVQLGCRLLRRLLDRVPDADAVMCQDDLIALGALSECRRLGILVPDDFGICGFNDLDFAAFVEPPLTTVRVPGFETGYRAADMLIRQDKGEHAVERKVDTGSRLIERRTTRRL